MSRQISSDQMRDLINEVVSVYVHQFLSSVFQFDRKSGEQVDFTAQWEWLCGQIAPDVYPELAAHFPDEIWTVAQANHRLHDILAIVRNEVHRYVGVSETDARTGVNEAWDHWIDHFGEEEVDGEY